MEDVCKYLLTISWAAENLEKLWHWKLKLITFKVKVFLLLQPTHFKRHNYYFEGKHSLYPVIVELLSAHQQCLFFCRVTMLHANCKPLQQCPGDQSNLGFWVQYHHDSNLSPTLATVWHNTQLTQELLANEAILAARQLALHFDLILLAILLAILLTHNKKFQHF